MTTTEIETQKPPVSPWKVKAIGLLAGAIGLVSTVRAAGEFDSVTAIVADVTLMFPALVAVVIAVVPILIIVAIVGFVTGLFDGILGRVKL